MLFAPFQVLVATTDRISLTAYSDCSRIASCSISPLGTLYTANLAVRSRNAGSIIAWQVREQGRSIQFFCFFRCHYSRFSFRFKGNASSFATLSALVIFRLFKYSRKSKKIFAGDLRSLRARVYNPSYPTASATFAVGFVLSLYWKTGGIKMKNITKFKSKQLLEVNAENTGNPVNLNVKRFILRAKTRLIIRSLSHKKPWLKCIKPSPFIIGS